MDTKRSSTQGHGKHSKPEVVADDMQETQVIPQQSSSAAAAAEAQAGETVALPKVTIPEVVPSEPKDAGGVYADPTDATELLNPVASNVQQNPYQDSYQYAAAPMYQNASDVFQGIDPVNQNQAAQMQQVDLGPKRAKRKGLKVALITLLTLLVLVGIAYGAGVYYFQDHFLPNTTVGASNISLMSSAEAEQVIDTSISKYNLNISGEGLDVDISAADAGLTVDSENIVKTALNDFNHWAWPMDVFGTHNVTGQLVTSLNGTGLQDSITAAVNKFNETARQPQNASVTYSAADKKFIINPEVAGTAIDAAKVVEAADAAITGMQNKVKLTDDVLLKPTVLSTDAALTPAVDKANTMLKTSIDVQMNGTSVATLDSTTVADWVTIGDDFAVNLDEGKLTEWVQGIADRCNTVGGERTYTRPNDGKVCTVSGGSYGWLIDNDGLIASVRDAVNAGTVGPIAATVTQEGTGFTTLGGQDWGSRYIDVDLSQQHAYMFDDSGAVIWESGIVSGLPTSNKSTPTGVYVINLKHTHETLHTLQEDGVTYKDTIVEYWMPFVGNSVGLHDAWWQPSYAFSDPTAYQTLGSHGCVNLPSDLAASLYSICEAGDVVVVHW